MYVLHNPLFFFFFNDTATTEIYTLSLHDALPIRARRTPSPLRAPPPRPCDAPPRAAGTASSPSADRKSTRLNSCHMSISYAVFCLKKKKKKKRRKNNKKKKRKKERKKKKKKKK